MKTTVRVEGMHCQGCVDRVRRALEGEPGIRDADVSLDEGRARVTYQEGEVQVARIVDLVEGAGYEASVEGDGGS